MTNRIIDFPNLGIHLKNVGDHITIFGFDIAFYGIIISIGVLMGVFVACREARRTGQDVENYFDLAIYGVIISIFCARIYYVIFSWDNYKDDLLSILNIRQGGLAIYGGIIGAIFVMLVYTKRKKLSTFLVFDTVSFGLVIGQCIGRWGNFFNREVFGEYTNNLVAMRLPINEVRASDVSQMMLNHLVTIDGVDYIQVHPTFLYESLWCLTIFLLLLLCRNRKRFNGELFLIYMGGYGIGRFIFEGIRTDKLLIKGTHIPVSQMLAAIFAVVSVALIIVGRVYKKKKQS